MLGQVNGLPVHALVLHAAVLVAPLAALAALATLVPRWRPRLRWPLVTLAALAAAVVFLAKESGEVLEGALGAQIAGPTADLVARHEELGEQLWLALLALLVLGLVGAVAHARAPAGWLGHGLAVAAAVVAVSVLALVVQTGETGAKARWNPDGSFDYSGS